jgi:alkylation response protein AidB-like acyl-CoA dehydrogenase
MGDDRPVPLDEYPVHQAPLSMKHVATGDRNAYDRCIFHVLDHQGRALLIAGLGVYPNLGVTDAYATDRQQFGRPISDFQGLRFMLADMATQIEAGRALYLAAARLRDAGRPFARQAAMAKLFCTDTAMRVTTDAVQVLGGYGYTADFPVERYMREAKVLQIVEGTNQIQRMVIARHVAGPETR